MAQAQKISHFQNRLTEVKLPEARVLPGMMVSFQYGAPTAYDRRPLFIVLHFDRTTGLMEGMNLNYLKESDIQLFHKECKRIGVDAEFEDVLGDRTYVRLQMNTKFSPNRFDGKVVYKMLFHRNKRYKRAYRSYKLTKVTSLKVVSYLLEVLNRYDDNYEPGDTWRVQSGEDFQGYVWRAKSKDGKCESFPSNEEAAAVRWANSTQEQEDREEDKSKDED
jgi:hypothetical protein